MAEHKAYTPPKAWWEEDEGLMDRELDDTPVSSGWRNKLGSQGAVSGPGTIGGDAKTDRLAQIQMRLARSANTVRNKDEGADEKPLTIAWSDGTKSNKPTDDVVYISPDMLMKERKGTSDEDIVVDGLTGQVLLGSAMKRTLNQKCWNQAKNDRTGNARPANIVWRALETAVARHDILVKQNLPGAADYFKRHAEQNAASKDELQKAIDTYKPSVELAAAALAWNIQYPGNKVTLNAGLRRAVDNGADALNTDIAPHLRYEVCRSVAQILSDTLSAPPAEPEPEPTTEGGDDDSKPKGGDSGEGGEDGKGGDSKPEGGKPDKKEDRKPKDRDESKDKPEPGKPEGGKDEAPEKKPEKSKDEGDGKGGEKSEDDSAKPEGSAPDVTDASMFGGKVDNESVDPSSLPAALDTDDINPLGDKVQAPDKLVPHFSTWVNHTVENDPKAYVSAVREMRPQINALVAALRFRNNDRSMFNRGCTSGDLDEGSLDKLALREDHPAIWERRELVGQPKVAVGLLLDQSGSMGSTNHKVSKMYQAREVCVAMAEALRQVKGVELMVIGHRGDIKRSTTPANGRETWKQTLDLAMPRMVIDAGYGRYPTQLIIYEWLTKQHTNPYAIMHAQGGGNNYDSFAMDYCVKKMIADYPDFPRRLLFVISDGQPAGNCYGGDPSYLHMRMICEHGRRNNVAVYGIGIQDAYNEALGSRMYGQGNSVVLKDVMSSLSVLTAFLRQVCMKAQ